MKKLLILLFGLCILFSACLKKENPTDNNDDDTPRTTWDQVFADNYKHVWMAGILITEDAHPDYPYLLEAGTAFKLYNGGYYTNAHVALVMHKLAAQYLTTLKEPFTARLVIASPDNDVKNAFDLESFILHPAFDTTIESADLAKLNLALVPNPPVAGIVRSSSSALSGLKVGQAIASLGYPGEMQYYNFVFPQATFRTGTISCLRTFAMWDNSLPEYLVEYTLDLTGGTSGSPVFNADGQLIAVNNSGFSTGSLNFGIRADLLDGLMHLSGPVTTFNPVTTDVTKLHIIPGVSIGTISLGAAPSTGADDGYARDSAAVFTYTDSLSYIIQAYAPAGTVTAIRLLEYDYDLFYPPFETRYSGIYIGASADRIPAHFDPSLITQDTVAVNGDVEQVSRVGAAGITFMLNRYRSKIEEIYVHAPGTALDFSSFHYKDDYFTATAAGMAKAAAVPGRPRIIKLPGSLYRNLFR